MTEPKQTKILGENTRPTKYNPDLASQVTHQIELDEQQAELEAKTRKQESEKPVEQIPTQIDDKAPVKEGFIFIPSINLYLGKERKYPNKDWYSCHISLKENEEKMTTIPQFIEFLKYLRANPKGVKDATANEIDWILNDILKPRHPYRAEWLDAKFEVNDMKEVIFAHYNHEVQYSNHASSNTMTTRLGVLVPKNSEVLEICLIEDRTPGIDLTEWLNNPTKQGLPKLDIKDGNLGYIPIDLNKDISVARFAASLNKVELYCQAIPSHTNAGLGVRPTKELKL